MWEEESGKEIAEIQISIGAQSIERDFVIEDGAIPEDMDILIQDMVDELLDSSSI